MILKKFVDMKHMSVRQASEYFGISQAQIYQYLYNGTIPRKDIVQRIFLKSQGLVSGNDFNYTTPDLLEMYLLSSNKEELLEELTNGKLFRVQHNDTSP